ncbi:putative suppressor for copper-sensitivity B precursor [Reticulomyxa filosa]|uniref:Putative suppressor for copper-sensitivity B n=1 Tax=Reticulomyxa filosa TaxID=46433 RepID=X6MTE5_RETFI|nr:putative suppressor for copper-sensitivity B precursor [Reticulomyxa filosa]|eukprot:ETO16901.1 putative suppressor for copper-sensitivity B precursor [Reticulomyxa filosa]
MGIPLNITFTNSKNIKSYKILWPKAQKYKSEDLKIDYGACKDYCLKSSSKIDFSLEYNFKDAAAESSINNAINETNKSSFFDYTSDNLTLFSAIIFAIIGGFILNFMPCVLPVISLKLFKFLKFSELKPFEIRINLIATTLGFIFSFIVLALMTQSLKSVGHEIGWGFQFQEPKFIIFLVIVLVLFASNLWGDFEINLPHSFRNALVKKNFSINYFNSFITGAFATLLATPCTAPFLSVAVAFGLSQDFSILLILYIAIGLGMSLPFIILAINPAWIYLLPKPGKWMITLKKFFAILLILTALWFIYILSFQISLSSIFILLGCIIILKAIITHKYFHNLNLFKLSLFLTAIIATYYLTSKMNNKDILHTQQNDLIWEKFSENKINEYVNNGDLVLVDVTAEWCLICKVNKFWVLENESFLKYIKDNQIKLIRADYTNKSSEITNFIVKHHRHGIPVNIIFSKNYPNGILLPEILTLNKLYELIKETKDSKDNNIK